MTGQPNNYGPTSGASGSGGGVEIGGGIITGLIGLGAGLYDSHQNRKVAKRNTDLTIAAQKAEAELAYQRQVEMWHMQNKYNSPAEQMARFGAAGLNPHLIYGQGNAGNANSTPNYQPPNIRYQYESGQFGSAVSSVIPLLMSVGSWMQNMRMSEVEIQKKATDTERLEQVVEMMLAQNPRKLQLMDNQLGLFPYQKAYQLANAEKATRAVVEMEQDFLYKYGQPMKLDSPIFGNAKDLVPFQGVQKLKALQEAAKLRSLRAGADIQEAKASWTDFNITDPQALMQMVLSGVMGLAGQQLRLSTHRGGSMNRRKRPTHFKVE